MTDKADNAVAHVVALRPADVRWPFRGQPYVTVHERPNGRWGRNIEVDPFPAYAHDPAVVWSMAKEVFRAFPLRFPPTYYLLPCEDLARTNGSEVDEIDSIADADERGLRPLSTFITLSAKRIPIHPAMTRYLVAHEYGHAVEAELAWLQWEKNEGFLPAQRRLQEEYAALRGLDGLHQHEGGGRWHASVQEIFACDFRLLVTGVETEYWPHPGIARPDHGMSEQASQLREWWREQRHAALERHKQRVGAVETVAA